MHTKERIKKFLSFADIHTHTRAHMCVHTHKEKSMPNIHIIRRPKLKKITRYNMSAKFLNMFYPSYVILRIQGLECYSVDQEEADHHELPHLDLPFSKVNYFLFTAESVFFYYYLKNRLIA